MVAAGNAARLTVQVGAGVAPGSYPLLVRGWTSGAGTKSVTLTLTVPPVGAITYAFCDPSAVPLFFAYQDGTGAWQPVNGAVAAGVTRFTFALTQGRGGVLAVYHASDGANARASGVSSVHRSAGEFARRLPRISSRLAVPLDP